MPPVVFENHPRGVDFAEPAWLNTTLADPAAAPRVQRRAQMLRSYEDAAQRPYIHLVDGGYGDYLGLQGPLVSFLSPDGDFSIRRLINEHKIRKLVIISANAIRTPDLAWDRTRGAPSWLDMLYFGLSTPIRNSSIEMVTVLRDLLKADHANKDTPAYESYFITVDFSGVNDPVLRQRLENLPTSLALTREQVDDLRRAAAETLRNSPEFQRLLQDLK
jgi:NTE family protein